MYHREMTRSQRLINNLFYYGMRPFGGNLMVAYFAWIFLGTDVFFAFFYGCGCTGTLLWEIHRTRHRRIMEARMLNYFGVPENVLYPALDK